MGYDIISSKTKKEWYDSGSVHHIQCQYAYQPIFKEALGYDIKELSGRLLKRDVIKYISDLDKIINTLENNNISIPMYSGNLSNCSQETLINEFKELKDLIVDGKIGYINIS